MDKVDRLGWTAGLAFEAYGVRIGVRTNTVAISDQLIHALPPGWTPSDHEGVDFLFSVRFGADAHRRGRRNFHLLYCDSALAERTLDFATLLEALEYQILKTVSIYSDPLTFIHAGVVQWEGAGVLLPGRSGSGKTTLVEALVKAGATYYSDEMAVLDEAGRVHPFPRDLSVRRDDSAHRVSPADLGRIGDRPVEVGLILIAPYRPGAVWRPRLLTPSRALVALFDNAVAAREHPERILTTLEKVVAKARAVKGRRGDAA